MDAAQLGQLSKTLLLRATTSNLQQTNTTDAERAELAAAPRPITGAHAQDYAAWRRAVLWVSGTVLLIAFLFAVVDREGFAQQLAPVTMAEQQLLGNQLTLEQAAAMVEQGLGKSNVEVIDNLQDVMLFLKLVVVVLVLLAARGWTRVTRSRHLARAAWLASLLVPLALAAFPWTTVLDLAHLDHQGGNTAQMKQYLALMFATAFAVVLGPKLLSILPGIMRSALTMKTLLPESMQTGWMTVLIAPFLLGFLLLVLCVFNQVQGSFLLIAAFAALATSPGIYLYRARDLLRPHPVEDAGRIVHQIRRQALAFNCIGVVLLVIYLIANDLLPWLTALHVSLDAVGAVLLTMIAFSDLLLALLRFELKQSAAFAGSPLEKSYETRLEELDQTGLTDLAQALRLREQKAPTPS